MVLVEIKINRWSLCILLICRRIMILCEDSLKLLFDFIIFTGTGKITVLTENMYIVFQYNFHTVLKYTCMLMKVQQFCLAHKTYIN